MKIFGLPFWVELGKGFAAVFRRFPLVVLSGITCAIAFSILIDQHRHENPAFYDRLVRLTISAGLGISTFLLASLIGERKRSLAIPVSIGAGLVLFLFGYWIPIDAQGEILHAFVIRLLLFAGLIHLGVAVVPFLRVSESDSALWEYNKQLLTRILLTGFFSGVFFVGASLALVSIDKLFGVEIDEENYPRIWFFCAFVLNTCLFLGGVPTAQQRSELKLDYPAWIQFFSKFILLPLVVIYFGILYVYGLKILFDWSWPNGMVGLPVFILAAVGGLTSLLVWPLSSGKPVTVWAHTFWLVFYPLVIPLTFLLLLALHRRIDDYGFTEIRYLGVVVACWLLVISAYYAIRPNRSYRLIPWSLMLVCTLFLIGPLSPANVAFNSQWKRLVTLLDREGLLHEGGIVSTNPHEISADDHGELRSIIRYIRGSFGVHKFEPLLTRLSAEERTTEDGETWAELPTYLFTNALIDYLGVTYENDQAYSYFEVKIEQGEAWDVPATSQLFFFENFVSGSETFGEMQVGLNRYSISVDQPSLSFLFKDGDGQTAAQISFESWVNEITDSMSSPEEWTHKVFLPDELTFSTSLESVDPVALIVQKMSLSRGTDGWMITQCSFWVLIPGN